MANGIDFLSTTGKWLKDNFKKVSHEIINLENEMKDIYIAKVWQSIPIKNKLFIKGMKDNFLSSL